MGKLDIELLRPARVAKLESGSIARGCLRMADSADGRLRASEELLAMATNASVMTRIVGNVGNPSGLLPVQGGDFVAGVAGLLMLFRGVRESGVINRRRAPRLVWRTRE